MRSFLLNLIFGVVGSVGGAVILFTCTVPSNALLCMVIFFAGLLLVSAGAYLFYTSIGQAFFRITKGYWL